MTSSAHGWVAVPDPTVKAGTEDTRPSPHFRQIAPTGSQELTEERDRAIGVSETEGSFVSVFTGSAILSELSIVFAATPDRQSQA
jgi:hypothetical protein